MNGWQLCDVDPTLATLLFQEERRQAETIGLIASENYVSPAVLTATGSVLTNKYSDGYPGRRDYEGQQVIDQVESLAVERAKRLFGVQHANVQPYSGSPANLALYLAFLKPGDRVMGMGWSMGGHLTHGSTYSVTGQWFAGIEYGVRADTGRVDLDQVRDIAVTNRPQMIFCGGTADPRIIDFEGFADIAHEVRAILVADIAHIAGLVAGGAHPSPVGFADVISTTTHKTLRGPRGAILMARSAEYGQQVDEAVYPGLQGGPHNHTTAAIAVALHEAAQPAFRSYTANVVTNARKLADALTHLGFDLVSGGTDNHLILLDLTCKDIDGTTAARALDAAGLETNYNAVPFDRRPADSPSGLRLGTAAVTTRGMGPNEMALIAAWIDAALDAAKARDEERLTDIRKDVIDVCSQFPLPGPPQETTKSAPR